MVVLGLMGDTCGVKISDQGKAKGERRKQMEEETTTLQTHLLYETMPLYRATLPPLCRHSQFARPL
jgi:hypothetical protein